MFAISPAYDILLRGSESLPVGLLHLHMATAAQLTRLHYSEGTLKAVKAKLKLLYEHGYVQYDAIPTKFTRSPYYYTMGRLGFEYIKKAGLDVVEPFRPEKEVDKAALFAEHTLELNDIIISAALLKRSNPTYWLESFRHERELKHTPYKARWNLDNFTLVPDTFLIFRMLMSDGRQRRIPIVIEHDRGSEEQYFFRRRIRAYLIFLEREGYKDLFGVGGITIAFSTSKGIGRLNKMREWTKAELDGDKHFADLFYFTADSPLDSESFWLGQSWYMLHGNEPRTLVEVGA
jgi:Replication-relaxation